MAEALCCDNALIRYIKSRRWAEDQKTDRKMFLFRLAQKSKEDPDFAGKIGGILIYNQVIEQFLADIVEMSIFYIKAKLWPVTVEMDVELDKATFGKVIEYFRQFATVGPNRELILSHLKKFNIKRNQVVHDLFDVEDLHKLYDELAEYADLADEIILLLDEYDDQVCRNFCQLERCGTLKKLIKQSSPSNRQ